MHPVAGGERAERGVEVRPRPASCVAAADPSSGARSSGAPGKEPGALNVDRVAAGSEEDVGAAPAWPFEPGDGDGV